MVFMKYAELNNIGEWCMLDRGYSGITSPLYLSYVTKENIKLSVGILTFHKK